MITYFFQCEACDATLGLKSSIKDPIPNRHKCPGCGQLQLHRVLFSPHVYVRPGNDEITVGLLAERNSEHMSSDQKEMLMEKYQTGPKKQPKKRTEKHFWETSDGKMRQIANLPPEGKRKYIETGDI